MIAVGAMQRHRAVALAVAVACLVGLVAFVVTNGDEPGNVLPALTATASPLTGTQFYVSPTGSDTASGSLAQPWLTLQHAADVVPAGATVFIRAGTYAPFLMNRSGTAAAPTKFANYSGEKPLIDGRSAIDYTIRIVGAAYVTLSGVGVTGGSGPRQTGGGVSVENSAHVVVQANEIHHNRAFGVRLVGDTDVIVADNDIHDNAAGVRVTSVVATNEVRGNRIHDNNRMMVDTPVPFGDDSGGEGVAIVSSTGGVTVEHNQLWRNRAVSYDYGYDGGAFSIYAASNWTIRNNVMWDNRNVLETGSDGTSSCANGRFLRNLAYGATTVDRSVGMVLRCASNALVANNTFAGLQNFTFDLSNMSGSFGSSVSGMRIVNNIVSVSVGKVYGIDTALPLNVVIDNNVVYDSGTGYFASVTAAGFKTVAAFQAATGYDLHSIGRDALFKAAASGDYSLQPGSPAVDHGVAISGVTDGFTGAAPDCGYLELRLP